MEYVTSSQDPFILSVGELDDNFADLMDLFETQTKYTLLFSTTKDKIPEKIEEKVYNKVYNQTIFSFYINSMAHSSVYEPSLPNPFERIGCAYRLKKQKQHIRIKIALIHEIKNYQEEYKPLIDVLNDFLEPEQITLGFVGIFGVPSQKKDDVYSWFRQNLKCKDVVFYNKEA